MFVFREIWRALFSRNTGFEIRPFALLPMNLASLSLEIQNLDIELMVRLPIEYKFTITKFNRIWRREKQPSSCFCQLSP